MNLAAELGIDVPELKRLIAESAGDQARQNELLRGLLLKFKEQPDKFDIVLNRIKERDPEAHRKLIATLTLPSNVLELQGWETWLRTLGPHTFTREFAPLQRDFWEWDWRGLQKRKRKVPLTAKEKIAFLPWSREVGKSTSTEWAAIAEGAVLGPGFVIWLAGEFSLAEQHVVNVRDWIESEEVARYYPHLGKPKVGAHGNKYGWGKEFLLTKGGWAIRPIGLDTAARGGKTGNLRPTMIVVDDLDDLGESLDVTLAKEQKLTRSILAMGDANTRVLVAQNPIHSNSIVNRMLTGICSALAVRTVFGGGPSGTEPVKAIEGLAVVHEQLADGPHHRITAGTSNWPGITIDMWQESMDRVGYEAFMPEYQHDFAAEFEERVLPEYDDRILRLHVITWEQFARVYNLERIPGDWPCDLGVDLGFSQEHKSAWTFLTKAPLGYRLAGSIFRYRGRTFTATSIDDQSDAIRQTMWVGEEIQRQLLSHEKLGERITLNSKHGWRFQPCDSDKNAGWAQWRHYLRPDRTKPHPFHEDIRDPATGLWRLGKPAWFDIVIDSAQWTSPRDDQGLKYHRDSAFMQRKKKIKLTESGLTAEMPMKKDDDPNDSCRMLLTTGSFGPPQRPLTPEQKIQMVIPAGSHKVEIFARPDLTAQQKEFTTQFIDWETRRLLEQQKPAEVDVYGQPVSGNWRVR